MLVMLCAGCLAFTGIAVVFPAEIPAFALETEQHTSGKCGDDLTWTLDDNGTLTISGSGAMWGNYGVNRSNWNGEKWDDSLVITVILESGVETIGKWAFSGCENLTKAVLPEGIISIGYAAFTGSGLQEINFPESLQSVGAYPQDDEMTYGSRAFTTPGGWAIDDQYHDAPVPWLEEQRKKNPLVIVNHILIDGMTCSGDVVIPEGVTRIENCAFGDLAYGTARIDSVQLPSTLKYIAGAVIPVFGTEPLSIPNGTERIEKNAFIGNEFPEVTLPESLKYLDMGAFKCMELPCINILNPECEMEGELNSKLHKIRGYENSTAEAYAKKNNIPFESLGAAPKYGDVNNDESIDLQDVTLMRRALAVWDVTLNETAADINKDGSFDLKDVVILRRYLAGGWEIELN